MKKIKNGFVFIETIIVVAFLAAALIIIYASFTGLLTSEKRRMYYDDPIYLYRTYYILDFLQQQDINSYVTWMLDGENTSSNENLLIEFNCNDPMVINNTDALKFCESIVDNKHFSVEHIYFTYYDTTPINECTNEEGDVTGCKSHKSLEQVSANALKYIRTLDGAGKEGYRMIVEYKEKIDNENRYYYSSVFLPMGDNTKVFSNVIVYDADIWKNTDKRVVFRIEEPENVVGIFVGEGTSCKNKSFDEFNGNNIYEYEKDIGSYVACLKDTKGHIEQYNFVVTKIDKTPPVCNVTGENSTWTNKNVKLDFKCSDPFGPPERTSGCEREIYTSKNYNSGTVETDTLDIAVKDIAGNETICKSSKNSNNTYNIYLDKEKPKVEFSPKGNSNYAKNQSTKVSVTKSNNKSSSITTLKYQWTQSTTEPSVSSFTQNFTNNTTITKNNGSGTWYLWVYAKDAAGNETITRSDAFYLDNTGPTCVYPSVSSWVSTDRTLTYGCDDNGGIGCDPSYSGGSKKFTTSTTTGTIDAYTIKDKLGNTTTCAAKTVNVLIDKVTPNPPTMSASDNIASGNWHNWVFTVYGNVVAKTGQLSSVSITYVDNNYVSSNTEEAGKTIRAKACSSAGLCSDVSSYVAKLDLSSPYCELKERTGSSGSYTYANNAGQYRNDSFVIRGIGSNVGPSGIVYKYFYSEGTVQDNNTRTELSVNQSDPIINVSLSGTTTRTYYCQACSGAGNCSNIISAYSVKTDRTAPSVSAKKSKKNNKMTFTASDADSGLLEYKLKKGSDAAKAVKKWTTIDTSQIKNGVFTVKYEASCGQKVCLHVKDKMGNTSYACKTASDCPAETTPSTTDEEFDGDAGYCCCWNPECDAAHLDKCCCRRWSTQTGGCGVDTGCGSPNSLCE